LWLPVADVACNPACAERLILPLVRLDAIHAHVVTIDGCDLDVGYLDMTLSMTPPLQVIVGIVAYCEESQSAVLGSIGELASNSTPSTGLIQASYGTFSSLQSSLECWPDA
jgi:hypothetical protein